MFPDELAVPLILGLMVAALCYRGTQWAMDVLYDRRQEKHRVFEPEVERPVANSIMTPAYEKWAKAFLDAAGPVNRLADVVHLPHGAEIVRHQFACSTEPVWDGGQHLNCGHAEEGTYEEDDVRTFGGEDRYLVRRPSRSGRRMPYESI